MISLIAAAFEDGWAFVRQGYTIYLVRPPYQRGALVEVSQGTLERAVHAHGFTPELRDFRDWGALISFLREKIVESAGTRPARTDEDAAPMRLLRHAPGHVIEGYVDRVERELLPRGEAHAALRLLTALAGLERVALDNNLRARVAALLDAAVKASSTSNDRRAELLDDAKDLRRRFPRAMEQWGEELTGFMRAVRQRGSLLAMGE
jgi:hypothetical protein